MSQYLRFAAAIFLVLFGVGCTTTGASGNRELKVLTYNIHHAEGTDGKLDLERIAKIIRDQNPDLVALQEVDDRTERTRGAAQAEELGRLTGLHHVFGKAMDYGGGGYGQAILSRWPIKDHTIHQLPQRSGREPRIMLTAIIEAPGRKFAFASTHLDHQLEEVRMDQVKAILRFVKDEFEDQPMLLAGDFNAGPESQSIKRILEAFIDTAGSDAASTIPASTPRRRIDYIFASPAPMWRPIRSKVLPEAIASDHRPVFAEIELLR